MDDGCFWRARTERDRHQRWITAVVQGSPPAGSQPAEAARSRRCGAAGSSPAAPLRIRSTPVGDRQRHLGRQGWSRTRSSMSLSRAVRADAEVVHLLQRLMVLPAEGHGAPSASGRSCPPWRRSASRCRSSRPSRAPRPPRRRRRSHRRRRSPAARCDASGTRPSASRSAGSAGSRSSSRCRPRCRRSAFQAFMAGRMLPPGARAMLKRSGFMSTNFAIGCAPAQMKPMIALAGTVLQRREEALGEGREVGGVTGGILLRDDAGPRPDGGQRLPCRQRRRHDRRRCRGPSCRSNTSSFSGIEAAAARAS